MKDHHICHKCGGDGIFLGSQEVGYSSDGNVSTLHDYECRDCQATWDVRMDIVPINRNNHES
jgi:hypothetical protein